MKRQECPLCILGILRSTVSLGIITRTNRSAGMQPGISIYGGFTTFLLGRTRASYIDTFIDRTVNTLTFSQVLLECLRMGRTHGIWMDNDTDPGRNPEILRSVHILVIADRKAYQGPMSFQS